jgi:soluble lytic murein transglycosylase
MVDWIELIPSNETRNYVQRVTENVVMYRAQLKDPTPILSNTPWAR